MKGNRHPVSGDEARYIWVRLYRKGREKGAWLYLDADLIRASGLDPSRPIAVKRYALRPYANAAREDDGTLSPVRGRVILNLSYVTETMEQEGDLTRRRIPRKSVPESSQ